MDAPGNVGMPGIEPEQSGTRVRRRFNTHPPTAAPHFDPSSPPTSQLISGGSDDLGLPPGFGSAEAPLEEQQQQQRPGSQQGSWQQGSQGLQSGASAGWRSVSPPQVHASAPIRLTSSSWMVNPHPHMQGHKRVDPSIMLPTKESCYVLLPPSPTPSSKFCMQY